jgi:hypothetical protein
MASYTLKKSKKKNKKYDLIITEPDRRDKIVSFGAAGMSDYTLHHDPERKQRYIKRHSNDSKFWGNSQGNLRKPSYLAKNILWNQPSLEASVRDVEKKLGVTIKRR